MTRWGRARCSSAAVDPAHDQPAVGNRGCHLDCPISGHRAGRLQRRRRVSRPVVCASARRLRRDACVRAIPVPASWPAPAAAPRMTSVLRDTSDPEAHLDPLPRPTATGCGSRSRSAREGASGALPRAAPPGGFWGRAGTRSRRTRRARAGSRHAWPGRPGRRQPPAAAVPAGDGPPASQPCGGAGQRQLACEFCSHARPARTWPILEQSSLARGLIRSSRTPGRPPDPREPPARRNCRGPARYRGARPVPWRGPGPAC